MRVWEGHIEGKLLDRISFPCCIFRVFTPTAKVCLLKTTCLVILTQQTEQVERWQRQTIQSSRCSPHGLRCPCQGFGYLIPASASSLLLNFLKYLCLGRSFGSKLSSRGSGHNRAVSLGRRQRWSRLERGGSVRRSVHMTIPIKKFAMSLRYFTFLSSGSVVSWEIWAGVSYYRWLIPLGDGDTEWDYKLLIHKRNSFIDSVFCSIIISFPARARMEREVLFQVTIGDGEEEVNASVLVGINIPTASYSNRN